MELERELAATLNRFSQENPSNTPDFILAGFLLGCLAAWNAGVKERERWYGRDFQPASIGAQPAEGKRAADAERELAAIDAVLGNRQAFDGLKTRAEKVEHLIRVIQAMNPSRLARGPHSASEGNC